MSLLSYPSESLTRYIGGKTFLAKDIPFPWTLGKDTTYCEPFVGGGSVALMQASVWSNCKIVLNDKDPEVVALWRAAIGPESEFKRLLHLVNTTNPTLDLFEEYQYVKPSDPTERALRFLVLNRCCRVESNGKRPLGGWYAKDFDALLSRWKPKRHQKELREARELFAGRTIIYEKDFADILAMADPSWKIYCDPPYFEIGNTLYGVEFHEADHIRLRDALRVTPADFVLSYGDHPKIWEMYSEFTIRSLASVNRQKKREAKELVILPPKRSKVR
jgi:DNA adenine methylase